MAMTYNACYLRRPGGQPAFRVGEVRALVAEQAYLFSLYDADVLTGAGKVARHLLVVPVAVSAASSSAGIGLTEADSQKAEAGDLREIAALANAVQGGYRRFRVFPTPELGRFIL